MPGFNLTYQRAVVSVNGTVAIFALNVPTNQKVRLGVNVFFKDATGAAMGRVEIRRRGTDDGTKSAAITWVKVNAQDAETPQSSGYTYSAPPTNDGSVIRAGDVTSQRNIPFPPLLLEGGGKYTVFVITPSAINTEAEITLEE